MAQCRVTDFYAVQKKSAEIQPSKRRKTVRMNEPPILTAKKNKKDFEAPTLVVVPDSSSSSTSFFDIKTAPVQKSDFAPNEKPEISFANNNNEEETVVFSAKPNNKEAPSEEKPTRTRSRKAKEAEPAAAKPASNKGRGKRGGRKKKSDEDDDKQKDIREALGGKSASEGGSAATVPPPVEVVGEQATAHFDDHELVVTPPSSPSKLKELQQCRKRPKKVAVIVRVTEEESSDQREPEDGGSPQKIKRVEEDGSVTPKRTPHQILSPSQMLTPSPRTSGCLPGSIKKLTLSSARKKLNLGGDGDGSGAASAATVRQTPKLKDVGLDNAVKNSPILEKARNMMKRLSESVSPSASPTASSPSEETTKSSKKLLEGESTPKGKGKGKGASNRVEELKAKMKEAKEKAAQEEQSSSSSSSSPSAKQGFDSLISRLGKSNAKKQASTTPAAIEHGQETQSKSKKLLALQAKLKVVQGEKKTIKKDISKGASSEVAAAAAKAPSTAAAKPEVEAKKKTPAFEKYAHLAEKVDAPNGELPLPFKYKLLLEFFRNMDQAVSLYYNRKEMITFSKLRSAVQELTRRSFDEKHLAQIVTVYPESYELRREKAKNLYGLKNSNTYELTVEPRLTGDVNCDQRQAMSSGVLVNRKNAFHHSLINIVRRHHTKFLENLTPPVIVDESKVQRWHPKFRLDDLAEVALAELPKAPEMEKFSSAKDVLDKAKGSLNVKVEAALKQMAAKDETAAADAKTAAAADSSKDAKAPAAADSSKDAKAPAAAVPATSKVATKGIPAALLAKIREKEAKKAVENLVMSGEKSSRQSMLGRLPELVKILRNFFLTAKKPAMLVEEVVKKVKESHKSAIAGSAVHEHLALIAEIAPLWLTITKLGSGTYVKINRTMDINLIVDEIEKEKKK